jgi:type I restriction enzyme M protein
VEKGAIKQAIYDHPEFTSFLSGMETHFAEWQGRATTTLKALQIGCRPKAVIADLGESLLVHYKEKPLLDSYDVYQHLRDYWAETMQDDCYLIASDGWKAEPQRVIETKKGKEGKADKITDKGWICDLVPKQLLVSRYFPSEQTAITGLESEVESLAARITELEEEHGGEEGAFGDLEKINKAEVSARLREIRDDPTRREEVLPLKLWLDLASQEADRKKSLKDAEAALDAKALAKYPKLTEAEVKTLVVEDKWMGALSAAIHGEMERISQTLTQWVKELAERYETPLPQADSHVEELERKVTCHLQKMGFSW